MPDAPAGREWWQITEKHIPELTPQMARQLNPAEIAAWRDMPPEVCMREVRARCQSCRAPSVSHMEPAEVKRLSLQYGDLWGLAQLQYLGWNTDAGICPDCYGTIQRVQAQLEARRV